MKGGSLFLLGVFLSRLGDSFSFLAFVLILATRSENNGLVSLFMVAHYLPGVLIGLIGGKWFDHLPKRSSLILSYVLSGAFTLVATQHTSSSIHLLALSFLLGITYGFYVPLQKAFVAEVFPPVALKKANGWVQLSDALAKTLGFALAGVTFHKLGPAVSFSIDAASFLVIALLLLLIKPVAPAAARVESAVSNTQRSPALTFASVVFAFAWLGTGSLFSLEAGYARTYLNASEAVIGALFACATLGSIAAPCLINRLNVGAGLASLVLAALGELCFVAGYAQSSTVFPAIGWIIGYGTLLTTRHILLASWIHTRIPRAQHGSAFAFQQGLANLMMMVGMGLSGPVSELFGIRTVIIFAAAVGFFGILVLCARFYLKSGGALARIA